MFEDFFLSLRQHQENYLQKIFLPFFSSFFSDNVNRNNNSKYFLSFFVLLESKAKGCVMGREREVSAFMVYHESVKHIIPLYEAFGRKRDGEKKNQQLHIIKECQMCHTQFSVAARQKSTFICSGERETERKEKHISSTTE